MVRTDIFYYSKAILLTQFILKGLFIICYSQFLPTNV